MISAASQEGVRSHGLRSSGTEDARTELPWRDAACIALVAVSVGYNFVLAFINANVFAVSSFIPALVEAVVFLCIHALALTAYRREMAPWYGLIGLLLISFVARSLMMEELLVKYFREAFIIPTFIILGLCYGNSLLYFIKIIHVPIVLVAAFEVFWVDIYEKLLLIKTYYVTTRGADPEQFTTEGSELYMNAIRPGERFLEIIDLHRVSSVFLEPVSLGNYCVVMVVFICAYYPMLTRKQFWLLAASTAFLCFACDGRLAFGSTIVVVLVTLVAHRLPRGSYALHFPLAAAGAFGIVWTLGLHSGEDDLPGRLAYSVEVMSDVRWADFFGLSDRLLKAAEDTGFVYFTISQSSVMFLVLVMFLAVFCSEKRPEQSRLMHGAALFLSLTMLVSWSFLTIKIASILWFLVGSSQRSASFTDDGLSQAGGR